VAGLRYGAVGINIPSFVAFSFPKLSWGAYPGNDPKVHSYFTVLCCKLTNHGVFHSLRQYGSHLATAALDTLLQVCKTHTAVQCERMTGVAMPQVQSH